MKSLGSDKSAAKAEKSTSTEAAASEADNNGFFTANDKIDFSNVKVEPLFEEAVDFDTFSKSDFRAVKVKECVAVPKSKKLLQFTLDDGTGTDRTFPLFRAPITVSISTIGSFGFCSMKEVKSV